MVKVLHLALFATLLISFATSDESGTSGGSDQSDSSDSGSKPLGKSKENKKHEVSNDIDCDEPNPTNKCTCDFTDGLRNLNSLYCNACQQSIFLQWEQQIESSILVNINWTVAQRIILVYYSYQKFAQSNPDIDSILKYKSIKSYGLNLFLVKDLQSVAYSFADETIASTILLDGSNNCNLFDALRSAANSCGASTTTSATTTTSGGSTTPSSCSGSTTASSGGSTTSGGSTSGGSSTTSVGSTTSGVSSTTSPTPSTTTSAPLNCSSLSSNVNVLISQITVILQNVNLTTSSQLVQIYVLLNNFFIANPGSQSLFFSVQISGFYSIQSFFDVSFKRTGDGGQSMSRRSSSLSCGVENGLM
uniref:Uncharacterized protein n=1 Tax=Acrobeloides nanus TaxID=290746 RepID=A0A914CA69_9BILA